MSSSTTGLYKNVKNHTEHDTTCCDIIWPGIKYDDIASSQSFVNICDILLVCTIHYDLCLASDSTTQCLQKYAISRRKYATQHDRASFRRLMFYANLITIIFSVLFVTKLHIPRLYSTA